ncbi:BNR repeat-like domain-containing protein [Sphingobacterium nematocida]|uniref:exo-alpha-sialidase n=1 Tax=Sphingobacterium nematocida TaxID=1513896 RepID=A0A1T5GER5_9SPHI|nr:sialidase family protein [Sphingobacterium nematocida]SKC06862.1 BNR repeat-like domain-containing protein [Sphingobacterium nematocida]
MKTILQHLMYCCVGVLLLSACYKEQHWDFPGPFEEEVIVPDSLPFPFDANREAGIWLMKEGQPFHEKVLFKGFTDYYAGGDTLSWLSQPDGMRLIQHRNPYPVTNADHVGGRENSYRNNYVVSKYFVPVGKGKSFYMYFKATIGTFNGTAAGIVLGSSWENGKEFIFGFDGFSNVAPQFFLDLYEKTFSVNPAAGWPTVNEVITPGMPAEFETVIVDNLFYIKVNGVLCFKMQLPEQQLFYYTPSIRPWRNFMTVHDFYMEAPESYTVDYAFHHKEFDYNFIQRPALSTTANGDILLFAEGRGDYIDAYQRIAQNTRAIGNTDIILRKSVDGGNTWSKDIAVLAGENSTDTYANPQVVKTSNGTLILQYSKLFYTRSANNYIIDPNRQIIYQRSSTDNGVTWSPEINITEQLRSTVVDLQHVAGHGIALRQAARKDRLVMPLNAGTNQVRVVYSDDMGATWKVAGAISGTNLRNPSVVELNDGRLMMLLSHTSVTPRNKMVSYSTDGGATWTAATSYANGLATGDFGHTFPAVLLGDDSGKLYCATPLSRGTDPRSYGMSPVYANSPTLYASDNQGQSFNSLGALFNKMTYNTYLVPVGNMDAVVLPSGKVLIATEGGINTPFEGIVTYKK